MQIDRLWRRGSRVNRYMTELSNLLEDHGHETIPFAVRDRGSEPSPYLSLFVSPLKVLQPFRLPPWEFALSLARVFYSREAASRVALLAEMTHPDVAHLHRIYIHLSPSVMRPLVERGIAVVMSVHDSKLVCPSRKSFRDGGSCFRCRPFHYAHCITGKCIGSSRLASIVGASEMLAHDLLHAYTGSADMFITPSWFMADRLVARGIPREKVAVVPYFVDPRAVTPGEGEGDFVLFAGSMSPEEGIETLIEAAAGLPHVPLKIIDYGMEGQEARELAWKLGAENVEFLGYRSIDDFRALVAGCRFLCLPFANPVSAPVEMLEAFAAKRPVLSTHVGGIPEAVRNGVTGRLVPPGNVEALRDAIAALWDDDEALANMGAEARRAAEGEFSRERHYQALMDVYLKVKKS